MSDVLSEIRSKAETGEDIVYSLIEDTHDVHMDVNGWEFNRAENRKDIEGKWVRCKDVEKVLSNPDLLILSRKKLEEWGDSKGEHRKVFPVRCFIRELLQPSTTSKSKEIK